MTSPRSLAMVAALALLGACDSWPGLTNAKGDDGLSAGGGTRVEDTSGRLGSACANGAATCFSGLECVTDFPGGICTHTCQSDSDCTGAACVLYGTIGLLCLPTCTSDQLCRSSYSCTSNGTASVCAPDASSSLQDAGDQ
jgi:hypothetical protein